LIYEFPTLDQPIRQGDVFTHLPRIEISFENLTVLDEEGPLDISWEEAAFTSENVKAILPVRPVTAVVITQDCDTLRANEISLCEIRPFRDVEGKAKHTKDAKGWVSIITQHSRMNLKWFYLPPDDQIGFDDKMAVDFSTTLRIRRVDLEGFRRFRKGRLNSVADEHFRERLAEFFRRYPYDEWYALDAEELAEYRKRNPEVAAFPWQK